MATETQDQPAEADSKQTDRPYGIYTEVTGNVGEEQSAADLIAKLQELAREDGGVTMLVRAGRAVEKSPKRALEALGGARDLSGDYDVIADSARNTFKNVTSKMERTISIG